MKDMGEWHCLNCVIANEWPTPEAFPLQACVLLGWVCERCMEHANIEMEQLMHYRLDEREFSSESDDSGVEQHAENPPGTKLESLVQIQLMKMRRPGTDHRSESTVA